MNKRSFKIFVVALGLVVLAATSHAALKDVDSGPYTAATGFFPLWYQDTTNTTLDLCLSKTLSSRVAGAYMCSLLPNLGPPVVFDDALPVVFPYNFPDEAFWFTADAFIDDAASGIDLSFISAVEAAFGGPDGLPAPGDQISFARIRIRASVPTPGTYVVTHPYGVESFTVAAVGNGREINLTRDIGIGATGVFTGALGGDIGPFLHSVNGPYTETNPDTGTLETFIGDPNLEEPVIGSNRIDGNGIPQNYVRIQGPNGIDLRTVDFAVSGRIWNGKTPTAVSVDRSSYTRTSAGTVIDVFATAPPNATVSFREALPPGGEHSMTGDGRGAHFGTDPAAPSTPPPYLIVTADNTPVTTPTSLASSLVDVVKIGRAVYTKDTGTLIVEATSSDQVVVPTLRALGLGTLNRSQNPQQLILEPLAEPPAFVTVKSSAGGSDTEPVVILPSLNLNPLASDDTATTDQNTGVDIDVLANDSDPDSDLPLEVNSVTQPASGQVVINSARTLVRYTPNATFTGTDSFTYVAVDARGGLSNAATVRITVRAPNRPPVANGNTASTAEDTAVSISFATLLANDTDPDGDTLSVTGVSGPLNGNAVIIGSSVVFTPTLNFNGAARFNYTVSDGRGGTASATVTVNVTPVNDPPVAVSNAVTTAEDTAVTILFTTLLANDTDVEGNPLTVTSVGSPINGSLSNTNGSSVLFTPSPHFNGLAGFSYTVSDGNGGTATGAVNVSVTSVNDAPVAANDTATTTAGVAVTINVLANDTDVEGNPLSIVTPLVQPATGGTVAVSGGSVVFTPASGFTGASSFTYQARDSLGALSNAATVSVTVNAAPAVDLNIAQFAVSNNVRTNQSIAITLRVRNVGTVNGSAPAVVVGVQNGAVVYNRTVQVSDPIGGGATSFSFPPFTPTALGNISWTATVQDSNPTPSATAATRVR
jgi:hypothetical protein